MSTCNILGTIKNSGGIVLSGQLWVELDLQILDETPAPDEIYTIKLHKFTITAGVVNINLAESETQRVTYRFRFFAANPDSLETGVDEEPTFDFHAMVPNQASVDLAQLLPTGITKDTLDTAIARLARILVQTADYREELRGGPNPKGAYDAIVYYRDGDFVSYGGSSWLYINSTPAAGITPSIANATYWMQIAAKGDAGGTGGQNTAYDATGWNGAMWAPTANVLRNIIETLARTSQLASYAPLNSPTFTGTPTRSSSPVAGDRTSQLATTQWVGNEFAPLASPALTGNPSAPTQALTDSSTRIATTAFVQNVYTQGATAGLVVADQTASLTISAVGGTLTLVPWNTERLDSANAMISGVFTVPVTGWYDVTLSLLLNSNSSSANVTGVAGFYVNGALQFRWVGGGVGFCSIFGSSVVNLTANQQVDIRCQILGSGVTSGSVDTANSNLNRLSIRRLF